MSDVSSDGLAYMMRQSKEDVCKVWADWVEDHPRDFMTQKALDYINCTLMKSFQLFCQYLEKECSRVWMRRNNMYKRVYLAVYSVADAKCRLAIDSQKWRHSAHVHAVWCVIHNNLENMCEQVLQLLLDRPIISANHDEEEMLARRLSIPPKTLEEAPWATLCTTFRQLP